MKLPECDFCKKSQKQLGALLFGPPKYNKCSKFHVCGACYIIILKVFDYVESI